MSAEALSAARAVDALYQGEQMPTVAQVADVIERASKEKAYRDACEYALQALRRPAYCGARSNYIRHLTTLLDNAETA